MENHTTEKLFAISGSINKTINLFIKGVFLNLSEKNKNNFWKKVKISKSNFYNKVPCWEWTGGLTEGYGMIRFNYENFYAHRISWIIENGEIPDNLLILHKCDNRLCVNPKHLFLGTIADNMKDKVKKGRQARGETHGSHTHPERWKERKRSIK